MLTAFALGMLTGILICIPIGPINIWVIQTYLKKGMSQALAIAAGGSLMDFVYFMLILSGLSFVSFSSRWSYWPKLAGILLILFLGVKELFIKEEEIDSEVKMVERGKVGRYFLLGVILYTSNPTLVLTMSGLATLIKSMTLFANTKMNYFLLSLGLGLGSFTWFLLLVLFIKRHREKILKNYLCRFSQISGILMLALGTWMLLKMI